MSGFSASAVAGISRCIGLYLLGISLALGCTSIRNISNMRRYNVFINTSASLLIIAALVMPFSTSSFLLDISNTWGGQLMIGDIVLYQISALLMYEAMHARGNAVIGDLVWFRYSVLFMRIINVGSAICVSGLFIAVIIRNNTATNILNDNLYTFGIKLVESIAIGFGFVLYGTIDYKTLSHLRGWAESVKILDRRRQMDAKKSAGAIKTSLVYIYLTVLLRLVLLVFKISSITGYYFPIDYYLYHIDIGFTLYQMRKTERVISRITGSSSLQKAYSSDDDADYTKRSVNFTQSIDNVNGLSFQVTSYLGTNVPKVPLTFDNGTRQPGTPFAENHY